MAFLEELYERRRKLADVLKDDEYSGIRAIVEELYPDRAHFIYELLQNAEDVGATEASFELEADQLIFEHDGRPFTEQDVEAITNIGKGTKRGQEDQIGRFGVGFKAVFAYTETPRIWSPTFSFEIADLALPRAIEPLAELERRTRFEFPFNSEKKSPQDAYLEIEAELQELAETTLLFLKHLELIRWRCADGAWVEVLRYQHAEHHIEVLQRRGGEKTTSAHFLRFDQPVEGLALQHVAIAYELALKSRARSSRAEMQDADGEDLESAGMLASHEYDAQKGLAEQMTIVPARPGTVAVYFPAAKEASGLRFHVHAPFVPELSRASVKETPANDPLFQQLAALAAESLQVIRDLGLLTREFLGVLPNSRDTIPVRYQVIQQAVVKEMQTQPLTPAEGGTHAPARELLQGEAELKKLLAEEDVAFLRGTRQRWAVSAPQRNSDVDRFLIDLAIARWDVDQLIAVLCQKAAKGSPAVPFAGAEDDAPTAFLEWLAEKPLEWHQRLYALLGEHLERSGWKKMSMTADLKRLQIVRLGNGGYRRGEECYFPSDGAEEDDEALPQVDHRVYTSGKSEQEQKRARDFLKMIGVREIGEEERVRAILQRRYGERDCVSTISDVRYQQDLKRFMALVERDKNTASMFKECFIFSGADGEWHRPREVYLDQPFLETGLAAYYEALGEETPKVALAECYREGSIDLAKLAQFAEHVGVATQLPIVEQSVRAHPMLQHYYYDGRWRWTHTHIDSDWYVPALSRVLDNPTIALAKLLWETLKTAEGEGKLYARFRPNQQRPLQCKGASWVLALQKAAWVPQEDRRFVRPAEAKAELLPEGFAFDKGWPWLKAIGFGEDSARKKEVEAEAQVQAVARERGLSGEGTEKLRTFAAFSPELQDFALRQAAKKQQGVALPEREPVNPERRAMRVREEAQEAPERSTEMRLRSVPVDGDAVKEEARQYLRMQYTNDQGVMICQVCQDALPFKLDDGSYYFEAVEFLAEREQRHYQNYLALCPNHAAMFMHANGSKEQIFEMLRELKGKKLEVILAQENATIYFTTTHLVDLKAVIEA